MSTFTNILVVQLEHIWAPAETFAGYNAEKTSVLRQYLASDKKNTSTNNADERHRGKETRVKETLRGVVSL